MKNSNEVETYDRPNNNNEPEINQGYNNSLINNKIDPIGYLVQENTKTSIPVYSKISKFKRYFIKLCFGFVYYKKK